MLQGGHVHDNRIQFERPDHNFIRFLLAQELIDYHIANSLLVPSNIISHRIIFGLFSISISGGIIIIIVSRGFVYMIGRFSN